MLKNLVAQMYAAVAAFVKQNPAIVSYVLTMAVTLAASFGFHVSATELTILVGVAVSLLHTWLHVTTRKA
jgi:uncharacterized membrane protein